MHAHPLFEGKFCQVVVGCWKPNGLREFWHVPEGSIQVEGASMVPALQFLCRTGLQSHAHASMGTDVRVACGLFILDEHHRLAIDGFDVLEWQHVVGLEFRLMSCKLPAVEH